MFYLYGLLDAQVDDVVGRDVDGNIFPDVWGERAKPVVAQALFVRLKSLSSKQAHIFITLSNLFRLLGRFSELSYQASGEPPSQRLEPSAI